MPQKGIELPVNSVIIIALAIFVLLMLSSFFGKSGGELDKTSINTAFNQGCSQLSTAFNCDRERVHEVNTNLVVNGQAKSLLDVCRMSFNNPSMSEFKCMRACSACPYRVSENSYCEEPEDCISPLTPAGEWVCDARKTQPDVNGVGTGEVTVEQNGCWTTNGIQRGGSACESSSKDRKDCCWSDVLNCCTDSSGNSCL